MYDNNMIMSLKQKKRKFEPMIKLNHNIYTGLFCGYYIYFNPFIHELYITTHVEPPPLYCCIFTDNFAEGISEILQTINEIKK